VDGSNNTVIAGNDGSTIIIGNLEKPFLEKEISVEGFLNTKIKVQKGNKVFISATGSIKVGQFAGYSGPDGKEGGLFNASLEEYNIVSGFKHAALMFKLDESSNWKECGKNYKFTANKDGDIIFQINDNNQNDNEGAYTVTIQLYH